jgi:hypothetical protein
MVHLEAKIDGSSEESAKWGRRGERGPPLAGVLLLGGYDKGTVAVGGGGSVASSIESLVHDPNAGGQGDTQDDAEEADACEYEEGEPEAVRARASGIIITARMGARVSRRSRLAIVQRACEEPGEEEGAEGVRDGDHIVDEAKVPQAEELGCGGHHDRELHPVAEAQNG